MPIQFECLFLEQPSPFWDISGRRSNGATGWIRYNAFFFCFFCCLDRFLFLDAIITVIHGCRSSECPQKSSLHYASFQLYSTHLQTLISPINSVSWPMPISRWPRSSNFMLGRQPRQSVFKKEISKQAGNYLRSGFHTHSTNSRMLHRSRGMLSKQSKQYDVWRHHNLHPNMYRSKYQILHNSHEFMTWISYSTPFTA